LINSIFDATIIEIYLIFKKLTMRLTLAITFLFSFTIYAQDYKSFQGKLVYSIQIQDTALQKIFKPKTMTVYTNDTIVRIENFSDQLGQQVVIKHLKYNKSILLLEAKNNFYAIQTDLNIQDSNSIKLTNKVIYNKKIGKRKIAGLKANRILLTNSATKHKMEILYLKDFSPKYLDAYNDIPGLPVKYSITTEDGTFLYTLVSMEKATLNRDLFGVPSNYKRVSFSQFLKEVVGSN
jgi:hypothetical protein